ncbi:hypothetical protein SAMN04488063_1911 [Halopelagius inordinatus]|uniref:Uncharacterized protein n=1 Tax=Halopelagius inordinatus TaxID=553467 RepID=A0A1I2RHV0_9EURY|nr:hypothetical protein [Halopelagius inordinatus]SFG39683.1 hypothetical protein SAMN04488063_1911 [Halopelagius inordinatus]
MVISPESLWNELTALLVEERRDAVVYADAGETVLHRGDVRVLANGWVELPSGRLISPQAVHHIETYHEQESRRR